MDQISAHEAAPSSGRVGDMRQGLVPPGWWATLHGRGMWLTVRGAFARGADRLLPWWFSTAQQPGATRAMELCAVRPRGTARRGACAEGVLGAAFPTLSRLRTDWTHIDIDWDSLDLPVPGSLELMRVRQGRANRTASVSLSISPSPLAAKA